MYKDKGAVYDAQVVVVGVCGRVGLNRETGKSRHADNLLWENT